MLSFVGLYNNAMAVNPVFFWLSLLLNTLWSGIQGISCPIFVAVCVHYNLVQHTLSAISLLLIFSMEGDIDSVDVFDEIKARTFSQGDKMSVTAVKDLYTLYKLHVLLSSGKFSCYSNLKYVRVLLR